MIAVISNVYVRIGWVMSIVNNIGSLHSSARGELSHLVLLNRIISSHNYIINTVYTFNYLFTATDGSFYVQYMAAGLSNKVTYSSENQFNILLSYCVCCLCFMHEWSLF